MSEIYFKDCRVRSPRGSAAKDSGPKFSIAPWPGNARAFWPLAWEPCAGNWSVHRIRRTRKQFGPTDRQVPIGRQSHRRYEVRVRNLLGCSCTKWAGSCSRENRRIWMLPWRSYIVSESFLNSCLGRRADSWHGRLHDRARIRARSCATPSAAACIPAPLRFNATSSPSSYFEFDKIITLKPWREVASKCCLINCSCGENRPVYHCAGFFGRGGRCIARRIRYPVDPFVPKRDTQ